VTSLCPPLSRIALFNLGVAIHCCQKKYVGKTVQQQLIKKEREDLDLPLKEKDCGRMLLKKARYFKS